MDNTGSCYQRPIHWINSVRDQDAPEGKKREKIQLIEDANVEECNIALFTEAMSNFLAESLG